MIWLQVLLLIGGLALIVFGADWLVDGASGIARRFGEQYHTCRKHLVQRRLNRLLTVASSV